MRIKHILNIILTSAMLISTPLIAADYIIDKKGQHAFITFKANHLEFSYIIGRFNDFEGTFSHDKEKPKDAKVNVAINASSLDTNHAERDKHLRGYEFFNVKKYPIITFKSSSLKDGKLTGDLYLRGITKTIEIDLKHIGQGSDPWGDYRNGFQGNVTLKAKDFGMPHWVGKVDIELIIEGIRQ